jgi:cation:H+ antiporter
MLLLTFGGFALLVLGGELLVRGAVFIARRFNISPLLIGLSVVAFCTSAPELVVSAQAALAGNPDISVGNVVGSNIANIALILGLSAAISPIRVDRHDIRRDVWMMLAASVVLLGLGFSGGISRWQGALLFSALVVYLVASYRAELAEGTVATDWRTEEMTHFARLELNVWTGSLLVLLGLVSLVAGGELLIDGATGIALAAGVPDAVVALTIVAVGTSLPELATSVVAVVRRQPDVAVGNVVGSTIFNILSILGITAMITPLDISAQMAQLAIPLMLMFVLAASVVLLRTGYVNRVFGSVVFAAYVVYTVALYVVAS